MNEEEIDRDLDNPEDYIIPAFLGVYNIKIKAFIDEGTHKKPKGIFVMIPGWKWDVIESKMPEVIDEKDFYVSLVMNILSRWYSCCDFPTRKLIPVIEHPLDSYILDYKKIKNDIKSDIRTERFYICQGSDNKARVFVYHNIVEVIPYDDNTKLSFFIDVCGNFCPYWDRGKYIKIGKNFLEEVVQLYKTYPIIYRHGKKIFLKDLEVIRT